MRLFLLAVAALGLGVASASTQERGLGADRAKAFHKLACRYWHLKDSGGSEQKIDATLAELRAFEQSNWRGLKDALTRPWAGPKKYRKSKSKAVLRNPPPALRDCWYVVQAPSSHSKRKPSPLVIALHGGGRGIGDPNQIMGLMGNYYVSKKCIVAAPKVPPDALFAEPIAARFVEQILWEVGKDYHVDYDRIYCSGHSLGGVGSWYMPCALPDIFAASASAAGNPPAVVNYAMLYNTAVMAVHGSTDIQVTPEENRKTAKLMEELPDEYKRKGYYRYLEITTNDPRGHALPHKTVIEMGKFMFGFRRNLFVDRVICVAPSLRAEGQDVSPESRAFWIAMSNTGWEARADARYKGDNVFEIEVTGDPESLTLYLSDDMVDLDKPVKVHINGRLMHDNRVSRDVKFMLDHIRDTGDRSRAFANRLIFRGDQLG